MKLLLTVVLLICSSFSLADNVLNTLSDAKSYYKNKKFKEAQTALEDATTLIQQKRGKSLQETLPKALSGWTENQSKLQAVGKGMFGGALTVFKRYKKGRSQIKVSVITDSPIIQSYLGAFSNTFLNAGGGELIRESSTKKGHLKYQENRRRGNLSSIIDNRFLLKIEGRQVDKKHLLSYFKAIDFKKIKAL